MISNSNNSTVWNSTQSDNINDNNNRMWMNTPKIIWICWFQGWNDRDTPLLQKLVYKSWKYYNEKDEWNIILLDDDNIGNYINNTRWLYYKQKQRNGSMGLAGLSNIVRIELLSTIGGIWVDSTVFCRKPLNDWLPHYIFDDSEPFFAFKRPQILPLATWFLFGNSNSYILAKWNSGIDEYWNHHDKMHRYHWLHLIFKSLLQTSSEETFQNLWKSVSNYSWNEPRFIVNQAFNADLEWIIRKKQIQLHIDNGKAPLYKLRHEINNRYTQIKNYTVLDYLVSTIPHKNITFEPSNKYNDTQQIQLNFYI